MSRPRLLLNVTRPWAESDTVPLTERALRCGFDGVGLADSPRLFPDAWLEAQRVLDGTRACLAGPVVASLGLRHPVTVAGALRTLEHHHPGRVLAVVGRGESSVRNEGLPVPGLSEYERSLAVLREILTAGGTQVAHGRLLGAASGPRTVAATARALGGVLLDVGTDAETVARAAALAREQDPTTAVWIFVRAVVTGSDADAETAFAPLLGSCAMRAAAAPEWFGLTPAQVPDVRRLALAHDYARHGTDQSTPDGGTTAAEHLLRERFALTGSAERVTTRLAALVPPGLGGVVVAGALRGVVERLEALGAALALGLERTEGAA